MRPYDARPGRLQGTDKIGIKMSIGSTLAVELAEADYREECAQFIANKAAQLVAARDMSREDAIQAATEELRQEIDAQGDITGVQETTNSNTFLRQQTVYKRLAN